MKNRDYLTAEEFKKKVHEIIDASVESLRKKLKQTQVKHKAKNKEKVYV